jgi:hypothetical protein
MAIATTATAVCLRPDALVMLVELVWTLSSWCMCLLPWILVLTGAGCFIAAAVSLLADAVWLTADSLHTLLADAVCSTAGRLSSRWLL